MTPDDGIDDEQRLLAVESLGSEWWPGTESNRRHEDFQSSALPTELPGHRLLKAFT